MSIATPFLSRRGSKARVARIAKVSHQAVSKWSCIPAELVLDVCADYGWAVTPHELRPDLYPHPDDGLPPELRGGGAGEEAA